MKRARMTRSPSLSSAPPMTMTGPTGPPSVVGASRCGAEASVIHDSVLAAVFRRFEVFCEFLFAWRRSYSGCSREPQSYFTAKGGQTTNRILNIDAYPLLRLGRVSHVLVLAEETHEKLEARHRQELEANRLRKKADQLASLEKAKSEFLRLASHELRGPAATLGGYLSMIEDESLGPVPQRLRPVLPMLRAKASQINLLANEMIEAARLQA